jgi:hypothetical protein
MCSHADRKPASNEQSQRAGLNEHTQGMRSRYVEKNAGPKVLVKNNSIHKKPVYESITDEQWRANYK